MESESHQTWEFEGRHERGEAQYEENPLILYPTRKRNQNRSESPPRKKIDTEFLLQSKDKTPLEVVEDDVEMEMSIANTTLRRYISSSLLFTVLSLYFFRSGINQFFFIVIHLYLQFLTSICFCFGFFSTMSQCSSNV